jgi:AraC-like DNA-binding protein
MMALLENSAAESGAKDLGLQLSRLQSMDTLGPVAVAIDHAATLGDAFNIASRYIYVHSPALRLSTLPVPGLPLQTDLCLAIDLPESTACAQAVELAMGMLVCILHLLCQGQVKALRVLLPHARLGELRAYDDTFGVGCVFSQSVAAARVNTQDLSVALPHRNALMRHLAQTYIDTQFTVPDQAFSDRVRVLVRQLLGTGLATQDEMAAKLAVHPRTMQRRLADEGQTFEKIKDEVRRSLFRQMMERPGAPGIAEAAALLDYTEPSALTRSCQRWFGVSPTAFKQKLKEK